MNKFSFFLPKITLQSTIFIFFRILQFYQLIRRITLSFQIMKNIENINSFKILKKETYLHFRITNSLQRFICSFFYCCYFPFAHLFFKLHILSIPPYPLFFIFTFMLWRYFACTLENKCNIFLLFYIHLSGSHEVYGFLNKFWTHFR